MNAFVDADYELRLLSDSLGLVDERLLELHARFERSRDPDSDGTFDRLEYLSGLGFVACQLYVTSHAHLAGISKRRALDTGPRHRCGVSFVALVNAAANYWKHEPEWGLGGSARGDGQRTIDLLADLVVDVDRGYYPVANALCALTSPRPHVFKSLLPFMRQWRDALHVAEKEIPKSDPAS